MQRRLWLKAFLRFPLHLPGLNYISKITADNDDVTVYRATKGASRSQPAAL